MKKRVLTILLTAILLLSVLTVTASAVVEKSEAFYVADYADVLSDDLEQYIVDMNGGPGVLLQGCPAGGRHGGISGRHVQR